MPPRDRDIAMVFQSYALYPHLTVYDNIAFGASLRGTRRSPRSTSGSSETAATLGLEEFLKRKPRALSGGQRQRVAMGRAIVRQPAAFLMDEPLSNLDAKLRVQTRAEIAQLQDRPRHDHDLRHPRPGRGDDDGRSGGRDAQGRAAAGRDPQELYDRPVNLFVGGFIGSPAMNMVEATLEESGGQIVANLGDDQIEVGNESVQSRPALREYVGRKVILGIRPEDLEDAALEHRCGRAATGFTAWSPA